MRFASAGSLPSHFVRRSLPVDRLHLRSWPRDARALSRAATLPAPAPAWFERPLGAVPADQFMLDLHDRAPRPVHRWLESPIATRGLADSGASGHIVGGTLAEWFDIVIHRQHVTPAASLGNTASDPTPLCPQQLS